MDIMRDVKSMSHVELKKYAKELGIALEDPKKLKKDALILIIKAHFEQKVTQSAKQIAESDDNKPKTRKKVKKQAAVIEEVVEEPQVVEEEPTVAAAAAPPVKKSSRRKEKPVEQQVEQQQQTPPPPPEEEIKVVKKKLKKKANTESVEEEAPPPPAEPSIKEKKTKKVIKKKKSKDEEVVAAEEEEEAKKEQDVIQQQQEEDEVESVKPVKKTRKVKKAAAVTTPAKKLKKTKSSKGATNVVAEPVVEHSPESHIEPLVLTNSPEPITIQPAVVATPARTPRRLSVPKTSDSVSQMLSKSASKAVTTTITINSKSTRRSSARLSKSFNASLLTNDDEHDNQDDENNITNDVQNATFDKPATSQPTTATEHLKPSLLSTLANSAKKVLACSSFYLSSATNNSPFKIPPIANVVPSVSTITSPKPTQEVPKVDTVVAVVPPPNTQVATAPAATESVEQSQQQQQIKRMGGGARIVKPTQTVLIKTTIVKENGVVNEQLREEKVEAVKREAGGPRIVKPVEEKIDTNKKTNNAASNERAKKVKSVEQSVSKSTTIKPATSEVVSAKKPTTTTATTTLVKPVPDFKMIHTKEASKFESIDAWADRLQQRHMNINDAMKKKQPTPAKKQPETNTVMPPSIVVSAPPAELTSKPESTKIPLVNINKKPLTTNKQLPKSTSTPTFNESTLPKVDMAQALFMSTPNNRDPATPKNGLDAKVNNLSTVKKQSSSAAAKTPASASRPKPQFNQLLKAAVTNRAQSSSQQQQHQTGAVVVPKDTNKPVLQAPPTGSFQRRKSFDLTASLSKPCNYKQYTGKLKPVDFNAKTVFLNNLAQAGGGGDKTMVKMNTTCAKPSSNMSSLSSSGVNVLKTITNNNSSKPITSATPGKKPTASSIGSIVKSSLSGMRTDKNEMIGMAKAEKLSSNLEKSRNLTKKVKAEQSVQQRRELVNTARDIENKN